MKKMKNFKYYIGFILSLALFFTSCQDDDFTVGNLVAPSNIQVEVDIVGADANNPNGDGSGTVHFTATADNAISYQFVYNGITNSAPGGRQTYDFSVLGLNTYEVTVIAFGTGGSASSLTIEVEVLSLYEPPADLLQMLHGGSEKTWRIKAEGAKHFGLGPVGGSTPCEWYGAGPDEKVGTGMYDDRYIFNADGTFTHITNVDTGDGTGTVFGREVLIEELGGPGGNQNGADIENYPLNDYTALWALSAPGGNETLSLTGTAFMGYYIGGNHRYEIFSRSANEMQLRSTDGNDEFDWWFILTAEEVPTGDEFESIYNNLVWSDEFDSNGAPNPANWAYDLGTVDALGNPQWGTGEEQTYTSNSDNVIVEDGVLKITARVGGDETYYYDEFELLDSGGTAQSVIEDFEGSAPTFTGFGGSESIVIANPDASGENTTSNVGQLSKPVGAQVWAGTYFELGSPLDLSANNRISVKTWSPKSGIVVKLKLENADASITHEVDLNTTVSGAWEQLVYDFSSAPTADYMRVVIFFDFNNTPAAYTSSRIKTQDIFEFTYGRVDVRAKLPVSMGTWPAIWLLGANHETVGWPASGEIDIMEQSGENKYSVSGTVHWAVGNDNAFPASAGESVDVPTATSEFHNYTLEWTPEKIYILVDGMVYFEFADNGEWPFNADFNLILNVAMGGNLGGDIDPAFTEDTMEIDYVRIYQ